MKRLMKCMFMTTLLLPIMVLAETETEVVNGIEWTYTLNNGCLEGQRMGVGIHIEMDNRAHLYNCTPVIPSTTTGAVVIPLTLGGRSVKSIGWGAFNECTKISSVTIPLGVTEIDEFAFVGCSSMTMTEVPSGVSRIGAWAFSGCSSLLTMEIPSSVTSIDPGAFWGCGALAAFVVDSGNQSYSSPNGLLCTKDGSLLVSGVNGDVEIPNGVTCIKSGAFWGCEGLTSITIPASVTNIEASAFVYCTSLGSVVIPDSVLNIPSLMFASCSNLVSVTMPSDVQDIGSGAFAGCSGLTSVTIPSSVTNIGDSAFSYCSGLTSVTIPSSVTSIGKRAFSGCGELNTIYVEEGDADRVKGLLEASGLDVSGLSFVEKKPDGGPYKEVVDGVEWTFVISNGEAQVGTGSPSGQAISTLTKGAITIPSTLGGCPVTSIGDYAFYYCSGLTSVTIPEGVTSIGDYAFSGCSGLTSVTIPPSVTSIGRNAFSGCSGLTSVTIPEGVTNVGIYAFGYCYELASVTISKGVTNIWAYAFSHCYGLASVMIPEGVTSIGSGAFEDCRGLTSVKIPEGVTIIGANAFSGCSGFDSVTIPGGVTVVCSDAFRECSGLTSVTIPSSVTSIGLNAFGFCYQLKTIVVDAGDKNRVKGLLQEGMFETEVTFVEKKPDGGPYMEVVDGVEWTFLVSGGEAQVGSGLWDCTVPTSTTGAIIIPSTLGGCPVTSIGDGAFFSCSGLTSVTIPEGVTSIGHEAFYLCSGLVSVTIPDGVKSFGYDAFNGCYGLTSVSIPSSVTSIESGAFLGCSGLTSVTIFEGVTSIGNYAFCGCSGLTSVTIPPGVTSIGDRAFSDCVGLTSVTMHEGVTSIGDGAFSSCGGLTSVTIPSSVTSIENSAFSGCSGLTSVTIPSSVRSIGEQAFESCSGLTSVTIPEGVTSIGNSAFSGCSGLTSVTIPSSVKSIGWEAFYGCPADCQFIVERGDLERVLALLKNSDSSREYRIVENFPPINELLPNFTWDDADVENKKLVADTDAPSSSGYSIRLSADDDSETWVETVVTGDVRVAFAWKASCESPMLDDKDELCFFDRLEFRVDGEAIDAIAGETNWSVRAFNVWGKGEHHLRWAYVKDKSDYEGDDCGWLADIQIAPYETIQFSVGGDESGSLPAALLGFAGEEVTIPSADLTWPRHTFVGWSDGETVYNAGDMLAIPMGGATLTAVWEGKRLAAPEISAPDIIDQGEAIVTISAEKGATIYYTLDENDPSESSTLYTGPFVVNVTCTIKAIAIKEDYFDSAIVEKAITRLPYTFGEYLGMENQEFSTSGDAEWGRAQKDGRYVLQSGAIGDGKSSVLSTIFTGSGRLNFVYAVSSEAKKGVVADGLALYVDDFATKLMWDGGEVDWKEVNFDIVGEGDHTVRWVYAKNAQNSSGDDCAWLDEIRWMPDDVGTGEIVVNDPDGFIILPDGKDITEVEVKVISNGYDIFPYLKLPQAVNGVIDLSQAEVKVEIVEAVLNPEEGAKIELNAENPTLTTSATIPGLTYTLHEGTTLESMQSGDTKVGDGEPWTPEIKVKGGKSAFYSISVGK